MVVLALALAFFLFGTDKGKALTGDTGKDADDKKPADTPAPNPPAPPPVQTNTSGTIATSLDPYTGEGAKAVESFAKSLYNSSDAGSIRNANNIGGNMFGNSHPAVSPMIKAVAMSSANASTEFDLLLVPSFVDGGQFKNRVKALISLCENAKPTIDNNGGKTDDGFRTFAAWLQKQFDLTSVSNFKLLPDEKSIRDNIIDTNKSTDGYGDANGSKNNRYNNYVKLLNSELKTVLQGILNALDKYENALRNEAILRMVGSGWKFIGFK